MSYHSLIQCSIVYQHKLELHENLTICSLIKTTLCHQILRQKAPTQTTLRQLLCILVDSVEHLDVCMLITSYHICSKEHHNLSSNLPQHLHQGRDASRLEDCKEPLTMVGKVVQGASRTASSLHITGVLHGTNNGRNHLWGAHQGVARCLLL